MQSLTLNTSGALNNGTVTAAAAYNLQAGTVGAALLGSVDFTKTGAGTVVLTNSANAWGGGTTVSPRHLAVGSRGKYP